MLVVTEDPSLGRRIEDVLPRDGRLFARLGGLPADGQLEVRQARDLGTGLTVGDRDPDVLLRRFDGADPTQLRATLDAVPRLPVILLLDGADEARGIEGLRAGAAEYLLVDRLTPDVLARTLAHAIERGGGPRGVARRGAELEAIDRLNRIGQRITQAVMAKHSREALEREVCERLVEADRYGLAWIGGTERGADSIVPHVRAGDPESFPTGIETTSGGDRPWERVAASRAPDVVRGLSEDDDRGWVRRSAAAGFAAVAAVPIAYDGYLHGVLTVYATRPGAFTPPAVDVVGRLGDVIAHAITALERRDALLDERVLRMEFRLEGLFENVAALTGAGDAEIAVDTLLGEDRLLAYGRAEGIAPSRLAEALRGADHARQVRIVREGTDWCRFELATDVVRPLSEAVSTHGGTLAGARIENGRIRFTVDFPAGRDKRRLIDLVEGHCAGATYQAHRTIERETGGLRAAQGVLEGELTEKQQRALEVAFHGGFFEWPRESSGQEIAERLAIAPATFSQHIRNAQQKVFTAMFEARDGSGERADSLAEAKPHD